MDTNNIKPSDFYRNLRPENFSDSYEKKENTLTPELLDFQLSKITTNQKHDLFEELCIEMASALICPNLIPQTGPTGGGDGKTDSETYPVSENISIKWYIPENGWEREQKWAFAVSAKKVWKPKVKDDVRKIVETKRGYTHIYFFTNQTPSSKQKSDVQDELKQKYGIDVTIFDGKWISKNIFSNNLVNLAIKKLNLSDSFKVEQVLGCNDSERKKALEELEEKISHPDRYIDFDYQIVMDSINAANISRHLELPESETVGRYERAKKINKKFGSTKLDIQISYQLAWTYYMYFDNYEGFLSEFIEFSKLLESYNEIDDLEFYSTLVSLIQPLSKQIDLLKFGIDIDEVEKKYINALKYFVNDKEKNTNHFIAKGHQTMHYLSKAIFDGNDKEAYLKDLKHILEESRNLIKFPFMMFKDQIEVLGPILIDSKQYDELIMSIAELESKRNSEVSSGVIMLERGIQKIKGKKYRDAVIFLGKSIRKLAKEESEYELYYAFLGLSIGYNQLGLNWVHYNSLLSALNIKMQYFFKSRSVSSSIIFLLKEIIQFEIIAGRIPSVLTWYELYLILSSQTDSESKETRIDYTEEIDRFISVMIANVSFDKLSSAKKLPVILNELGLEISKDTNLYILQGEGALDKETIDAIGKDQLETFFSSFMNQPLKEQFIGNVDIFYNQKSYELQSKVLGTNITICFEDGDRILFVESLLSFIEGFLATSFDFCPTVKNIDIKLTFTTKKDRQSIDYKLNRHEYTINLNSNFHDINNSFFYTLVFVLGHSFIGITKEKMEELFSSDEVFERVSLITSHPNIFTNIIGGGPKFQLEKWEKSSYKDIKILNTKSPLKISKIKKLDPDDSKERHDNREIQSIINLPLWDKAKWNSFAFVTRNPKEDLGLVIFFTDKESGRKIAEEIREMIGKNDSNEVIRLSIIKGIDEKNKYHYAVHMCNSIDVDKIKGGLFLNVSRYHILTPNNDTNIKHIEGLYRMLGRYTLYFGYANISTGERDIFLDLGINKRKLNIKEAKDVGKNDLESVVLKREYE